MKNKLLNESTDTNVYKKQKKFLRIRLDAVIRRNNTKILTHENEKCRFDMLRNFKY